MWKSGRRMFSTAAILMIVMAGLHTLGNTAPHPETADEQRVLGAMRGLPIPLGMGMSPSLYDIFRDLVFTMTLTFVALGGINLLIAADRDAPDSLLRRVAWFNAIWGAAFVIMNWIYQIPPPLISAVVIEAVIVASIFTLPRSQRR